MVFPQQGNYHIYSKYWDTLSTYHTCPKICNSPFYYLLMCLKYCCMYSKQCRPWLFALFFSVWSGSTLFAKAYQSQYLGLLLYSLEWLLFPLNNRNSHSIYHGIKTKVFLLSMGTRLWLCHNKTLYSVIFIVFTVRQETNHSIFYPVHQPLSCWIRVYPAFANSVDPDQLASEEANWSGSALFAIK